MIIAAAAFWTLMKSSPRERCPLPSLDRFEPTETNRDEFPSLKLPCRILVDDSQQPTSSDPTGRTMRPPGSSCLSKAGGGRSAATVTRILRSSMHM